MKNILGYRQHINRLNFAADPNSAAMRTFKFPLVRKCKKQSKHKKIDFTDVPEELIEAIKHDDLFIRGPSNLADYIKYKDKNIYTLIDFWLDSLRAGVVFMPTTATLVDFVTKIKDGKSIFSDIFYKADSRIPKYFEENKFIKEIITNTGMRQGKITKASFSNKLRKLLKKSLSTEQLYHAENLILEISNIFFDSNEKLKLIGQEEQNKAWLEKFRLNKKAVDLSFDLSFYIFPELAHAQEADIKPENLLQIFDSLIQKRKEWLSQYYNDNKEMEEQLDKMIGLSDNFNAFSNYFSKTIKTLKTSNGINIILELFNKVHKKTDTNTIKQLKWLYSKVQYLEAPQLSGISGWHDYRSLVGGKLQSWWTNHRNRADEQKDQIQKLTESFKELEDFINEYPQTLKNTDHEMLIKRKNSIRDLINEIKDLTAESIDLHTDIQKYETLEALVKQLRQQLNEYFQLYVKDSSDTELKPSNIEELKNFWSLKIYKPRSFYGYSQREYLDKIVNTTIPTIKAGIQITKHLLKSLQDLPDYSNATKEKDKNVLKNDIGIRRLLEALRNKLKDDKLNTKEFRELYENLLIKYVPYKSYLTSSAKTFFKSDYSTSTQELINLSISDYAQETKDILINLTNELTKYTQNELLNNPKLLLDFIETSKFVIARFLRWMDQDKEWELNKFNFHIFPAASKFIQTLNKQTVKTPILRFIIMSQMFSEFRGSATVFSKKYVTTKWNVQVVGSDSKFKLSILSKNQEIPYLNILDKLNNNSANILHDINWYVRFDTKNRDKKEIIVLKGKDGGFKISKEPTDLLLQICTSKYHLQFLERLIYRPKAWQDIHIKVSEPSLIVEERYKIRWNLNTGLPEIEYNKTNKPILYYALPFQFTVKRDNNKLSQLAKIKQKFLQNPNQALKQYYYLGADIGEYGIAWTILRINEDAQTIEIKDYGFEYDKQIRKIQDNFKEIQHKSKTGLFLESSTVIAKLRKNAIGYLRNKLHDKLINYGGHIIYEANISGFEVGVGKVTKIYDSVKRADIGNHPDVTEDVVKKLTQHLWGLKTGGKDHSPGWQIGAAGTSYTCINCGQSIYGLGEDKDIWIKVKTIFGSIHKFKHIKKDTIILGFKENNIKDKIDYKSLRRYARKFARPPLVTEEKSLAAVTEHFIVNKDIISKQKLQEIKKTRGNSAIFICPFNNCNAVVDADIQAAIIIALRGYLYLKEYYLNKIKTPFKDSKNILLQQSIELLNKSNFIGKTDFIYYKGNKKEK